MYEDLLEGFKFTSKAQINPKNDAPIYAKNAALKVIIIPTAKPACAIIRI